MPFNGQRDLIWLHLVQFWSIDQAEALKRFGCARLSARIEELRTIHGRDRIRSVEKKGINSITGRAYRCVERYEYVTDDEIQAPTLGL